LKKEIKGELRREDARRRMAGCGVGLVIVLAIVAIPVVLAASTLAKTGFVDVPFLTDRLYRSPEPIRSVRPLTGSGPKEVMQSVMSRVSFNPVTSRTKFTFSEQELTTLVQGLLADPAALPFRASRIQVAADPDFLEITLVAVRPRRNAVVRVRALPEVNDGTLRFAANEVAVGGLLLTDRMGQVVLDTYGSSATKLLNEVLSKIGRPHGIDLGKGRISIDLLIPQK
jgi:hypothetical protein